MSTAIAEMVEDRATEGGSSPRDNYGRALNQLLAAHSEGEIADTDFQAIAEFVLAHDPEEHTHAGPDRSYNTLRAYTRKLTHVAERTPKPLVDMTAGDVGRLMTHYENGNVSGIKDGGLSSNTVRQYQNFLRKFYEYHVDLPVEKDDISLNSAERSTVDEADVLTQKQVTRIREAIQNSRDRALFEFLYNTGMRFRVVQCLKIKHVNLDAETFEMPDVEGLKGAREIMKTRSLFAAAGPLRRWLQDHPTGDPNHYLFTPAPGAKRGSPTSQLSYNTIRTALVRRAEDAGFEVGEDGDVKVNPHNFRHTWVTRAKLDWDLDNSEIKKHLGHRPDSDVMEVTYSHLTDEEWIERMEEKVGLAEPDEEDETPAFKRCPTCSTKLEWDAKACPQCATVLDQSAKAAQESMQEQAESVIPEVENEKEARVVKAVLEDLRENPDELLSDE